MKTRKILRKDPIFFLSINFLAFAIWSVSFAQPVTPSGHEPLNSYVPSQFKQDQVSQNRPGKGSPDYIPIQCIFHVGKGTLIDKNSNPNIVYARQNEKVQLTFTVLNKRIFREGSIKIYISSGNNRLKEWTGIASQKTLSVQVQYSKTGEYVVEGVVRPDSSSRFGNKVIIKVIEKEEYELLKTNGFPALHKKNTGKAVKITCNNPDFIQVPVQKRSGFASILGVTCTYPFPDGKCYMVRGAQVELFHSSGALVSTAFSIEWVDNNATQYGLFPTSYVEDNVWYPQDPSGHFWFSDLFVGNGESFYLKVSLIFHSGGDGWTTAGTQKFVVRDHDTPTDEIISFTTNQFFLAPTDVAFLAVYPESLAPGNGMSVDEGVHAFYDCSKEYGYFRDNALFDMNDITIYIDLSSAGSPHSHGNTVELPEYTLPYLTTTNTDIITHEYSHSIQYYMRGGNFPDIGIGNSNHGGCANSNSIDGLLEGWASFVSTVVDQDPCWRWDDSNFHDISLNNAENSQCEAKEEWTAASILYDVWTEIDPLEYPHLSSFAVATSFNHDPDFVREFFDYYIGDWNHKHDLWEIFNNHSVNYDTEVAANPTSVGSTTHAVSSWSNITTIGMNWSGATDNLSGIAGYSWEFSRLATTIPDAAIEGINTSTAATSPSLGDGDDWYFHVRATDSANNWNPAAIHTGPFFIDKTAPGNGLIVINSEDSLTYSLLALLGDLAAYDSLSGTDSMQFSNNDLNWSDWETFSAVRPGWDLSLYGGNSLSGTKTVYVKYKDLAGNISASFSASIEYVAPVSFVQDTTVIPGQAICFGASETIIVAGNETTVTVQEGGEVTFISGGNIQFLPRTLVLPGGKLHGYITLSEDYCNSARKGFTQFMAEEIPMKPIPGPIRKILLFKAYPNPTTGKVVLELAGADETGEVYMEVYGMLGEMVIARNITGCNRYEFSMEPAPSGIYFLRVIKGHEAGTLKIIKQ
jgi:hypothetical protein